jgi:hypothetical protein
MSINTVGYREPCPTSFFKKKFQNSQTPNILPMDTRIPTGVHLMGVHLKGVHLMGVHLKGVHLMGVHLIGVYLIL